MSKNNDRYESVRSSMISAIAEEVADWYYKELDKADEAGYKLGITDVPDADRIADSVIMALLENDAWL